MAKITTSSQNVGFEFRQVDGAYSGKYPNLKYICKWQVRFVGSFIGETVASGTCEGMDWTVKIYTKTTITETDWEDVGTKTYNLQCGRTNKIIAEMTGGMYVDGQYYFGNTTDEFNTPQIPLPIVGISSIVSKYNSVSFKINMDDPYGIYMARVWEWEMYKYVTQLVSGDVKIDGLTKETTYRFQVYVFMADSPDDVSGTYVAQSSQVTIQTKSSPPEVQEVKIINLGFDITDLTSKVRWVFYVDDESELKYCVLKDMNTGEEYKSEEGKLYIDISHKSNVRYDFEAYVIDKNGNRGNEPPNDKLYTYLTDLGKHFASIKQDLWKHGFAKMKDEDGTWHNVELKIKTENGWKGNVG